MNNIEISEMEWYFRDFLFRNYDKGILKLEIENIPYKMVETHLRYRNVEQNRISSIIKIIIKNLMSSKFLQGTDKYVEIRDGVLRLQCTKCYYICYLGNLEDKICFRCKSEQLSTFPKKP